MVTAIRHFDLPSSSVRITPAILLIAFGIARGREAIKIPLCTPERLDQITLAQLLGRNTLGFSDGTHLLKIYVSLLLFFGALNILTTSL